MSLYVDILFISTLLHISSTDKRMCYMQGQYPASSFLRRGRVQNCVEKSIVYVQRKKISGVFMWIRLYMCLMCLHTCRRLHTQKRRPYTRSRLHIRRLLVRRLTRVFLIQPCLLFLLGCNCLFYVYGLSMGGQGILRLPFYTGVLPTSQGLDTQQFTSQNYPQNTTN